MDEWKSRLVNKVVRQFLTRMDHFLERSETFPRQTSIELFIPFSKLFETKSVAILPTVRPLRQQYPTCLRALDQLTKEPLLRFEFLKLNPHRRQRKRSR